MKISTPFKLGAIVLITLFNALLLAQTNASANGMNKGGPMGGPPPAEAIAACKSLPAGKDCSFSTPQGTEKGVCWAPEGKPLACKPNKPKGPPPKQ